ncbi:uncharacterized protein LOC121248468 [Juglans microcarpa x Juglans regia]|uniref:uncharacterized protein LOC121248468 n=1 Tax=Juglans microcarpa x Juglans regia TaxID=2249226 RepID=UPI001B7F1B4D|nr:uncharacterized protein LOC121248468 [Juglans microcarpa x Juglans regia]
MWDQRVVEKKEEFIGAFSIACSFKSVSDGFLWAFAGVYGPNSDIDRQSFGDIGEQKKTKTREITEMERIQESRRSNNIEMLKIDGADCKDEQRINDHVVGFFEQLLTEHEGWRSKLDGLAFDSIGPRDGIHLERPFEEGEVFEVVRKMAKDKAPGLDGFSTGFFQTCWEILKDDLMLVFQEFHEAGHFEKSLNGTFLVLAKRLSEVVGKIISKPQNAFVKDRQILNAVLIASLDSRLKAGSTGVLCKLDMEKAYDYNDLSLGCKWVSEWVFNRIPGGGSINISHLLFADDTLIFCEADNNQIRVLKALLLCFEAVSGLKVNLDKSKMVPIGGVQRLRQLANTLGCKTASLPMTYLGLPLGSVSRVTPIWDIVIEKVERRLAG